MKKLNCYCGASFEISFNEKIDLWKNPEVINQILDNNFMEYNCPACSKLLRPEYRIEFTGNNIDFTMIPEIERQTLLAGNILLNTKQVVAGFKELREKFIILKYKYDDRIIELIKLYLLEKINSPMEINILFSKLDEGELIFHIYGLKENETGISKIPEHIYTNI
ncbi:MAG: hypothetical protein KAH95_11270, partial [Spirochaetales bacterium]|nr:hypothetical protein [Spirochaetales bacterium]